MSGERESKGAGEAQKRADRIRAFRDELEQLEREGVLIFSDDQLRELTLHHERVLADLAERFDIDTTAVQKQMSWGMRIASLLGALALAAAVFFFFYRFWGYLTTPAQVGILIAGPVVSLLGMALSARRETTPYFTTLIGMVAVACFVLNLTVLGTVFNVRPTQNAFLPWAGFSFLLAYAYRLRLLQVAGILCLFGYLSATVGTWSGAYWLSFGERPENFLPAGILLFLLPAAVDHRRYPGFPALYRVFGLLPVFVSILILANWGRISYLPLPPARVETIYQAAGFLAAGIAIWAGIHWRWPGVTNLGSTFFAIYLYTKFFDWWWDWMPKYLFFLILGALSVGLLWILGWYRRRSRSPRS